MDLLLINRACTEVSCRREAQQVGDQVACPASNIGPSAASPRPQCKEDEKAASQPKDKGWAIEGPMAERGKRR